MKFAAFIHIDDMKCFHMAIQGTHELVVMGHISFTDHALIKKWQVSKKMNVMSKKFKDEIKKG